MEDTKRYFEIKIVVYFLQVCTVIMFSLTNIAFALKVMLIFGYIMLFRQERWHKHLAIMFIMSIIIFIASGGLNTIININ